MGLLPAREEVLGHLPECVLKTVLAGVDENTYKGMIEGVSSKGHGKQGGRLKRSILGRLSSSTALPLRRFVSIIEAYKPNRVVTSSELSQAIAEHASKNEEVVVKVNPPFVPSAYKEALKIVEEVRKNEYVKEKKASAVLAFSAASFVKADDQVEIAKGMLEEGDQIFIVEGANPPHLMLWALYV